MAHTDLVIVMGLGGLFILLGVGSFFWGSREATDYYKNISSHTDVREYIEHTPERPEPGGLKIGGILSIVVGLLILILGAAFLLLD
jgi:CHASE3 domain sensor protein